MDLVLVKVWSVSQHGKAEHDSAGGASYKCLVLKGLLSGDLKEANTFGQTAEYVLSLSSRVQKLVFQVDQSQLPVMAKWHQTARNNKKYTVDGISKFQVMVIDPSKINDGQTMITSEYKEIFDLKPEAAIGGKGWSSKVICINKSTLKKDRWGDFCTLYTSK